MSPGTSGKYGWRPVTFLPGMVACAHAAAGPQLLYQAIRATCEPEWTARTMRAMPAEQSRGSRQVYQLSVIAQVGNGLSALLRNQAVLVVPRPGRHPGDRRGDLPRRVIRQEDVPDGRLDVPDRILRCRR